MLRNRKNRRNLITKNYRRHNNPNMSICSSEKKVITRQADKIWRKIEKLFVKSKQDSTLTILIGMTTGEHYKNKGIVYYRFLQQREWGKLTKKKVKSPREVWKIVKGLAEEKGLLVREYDTMIDRRYSNDPCAWFYFIRVV